MMANKNALIVILVRHAHWFQANWSQFFTTFDRLLCLQLAKVPRFPDLVIFVSITLPLGHVRTVTISRDLKLSMCNIIIYSKNGQLGILGRGIYQIMENYLQFSQRHHAYMLQIHVHSLNTEYLPLVSEVLFNSYILYPGRCTCTYSWTSNTYQYSLHVFTKILSSPDIHVCVILSYVDESLSVNWEQSSCYHWSPI